MGEAPKNIGFTGRSPPKPGVYWAKPRKASVLRKAVHFENPATQERSECSPRDAGPPASWHEPARGERAGRGPSRTPGSPRGPARAAARPSRAGPRPGATSRAALDGGIPPAWDKTLAHIASSPCSHAGGGWSTALALCARPRQTDGELRPGKPGSATRFEKIHRYPWGASPSKNQAFRGFAH